MTLPVRGLGAEMQHVGDCPFDDAVDRCRVRRTMALFVKVRHSFGHRWMPFFLPVAASLLFILFAILIVPETFSNAAQGDIGSADDGATPPAASAGTPTDPVARAAARRRLRPGARPGQSGGSVTPEANPFPMPQNPQPVAPPASPDGND